MKVVVLEKETLAGVASRKSEPQTIPAIGFDSRGTEAVTIGLYVDVPRAVEGDARGYRRPRRGGRRPQLRSVQRRQAEGRTIAGFEALFLFLGVKKVRGLRLDLNELRVRVHLMPFLNRRDCLLLLPRPTDVEACPHSTLPSQPGLSLLISQGSFQAAGRGISLRR